MLKTTEKSKPNQKYALIREKETQCPYPNTSNKLTDLFNNEGAKAKTESLTKKY